MSTNFASDNSEKLGIAEQGRKPHQQVERAEYPPTHKDHSIFTLVGKHIYLVCFTVKVMTEGNIGQRPVRKKNIEAGYFSGPTSK